MGKAENQLIQDERKIKIGIFYGRNILFFLLGQTIDAKNNRSK